MTIPTETLEQWLSEAKKADQCRWIYHAPTEAVEVLDGKTHYFITTDTDAEEGRHIANL